jgi:hypothetical protein
MTCSRLVVLLCALLFCLDFVGILLGCLATAFGAIEEVKPVTQVTMDSDGLPLRFFRS